MGTIKRTAYGSFLLLQAAVFMALAACSAPPAEDGISDALREMADAIEARQAGPVVRRLTADFSLARGGEALDREQSRRLLAATLLRYPDISITVTGITVLPDGARPDLAEARFNVLTTGGTGSLLPETGQLYRVESLWRLEDGDWLMVRASARRLME
ncbi:hypothetical protein S7S_01575 [Isoalcanivorax pacificus W11-5]|uniref:DUF4440 domain-containing protein n=1 Tax=Isoalcanivorax pacificus W11-5 TaxID=391936 RepID=A0A0B4XFC0_9GAMM|nr:nuclear transport factor 2 family protein [Isoalcanivorax pacificus]AJD46739.1 hypothetical protein S7S_01575 [Isoalcanivorax pacificus W11-5]